MDTDSLQNSLVTKDVTFQSLLNELDQIYNDNQMKISAYKSLQSIIKSSEADYSRKRTLPAKLKLDTASLLIRLPLSPVIDSSARVLLLQDITLLKNSL